MKRWLRYSATTALALACSVVFAQQLPDGVVLFDFAKATWVTEGTPGNARAIIYGHPSKPGLYLYVNKVRPNAVTQAHTHPDARTYTVLSGTWYVGFGDKYDESKLIALAPGSFYTEPAGVAHFVATKGDGAMVQIGGTGPTRQIFVNPMHAPAKK